MAKNSLDLLRLIAASLVLYSHQFALLGLPEPSFFGLTSYGGVGVTVFFFLSGMLVWTSWARDPSLKRFFIRRSLRIFPALWVVVILSIFLLGPIFSTFKFWSYFSASETWRYLSTAALIPRNILPGVFIENPFPLAINGSLWTLPVEFLCYVLIAVVGCIQGISKGVVVSLSFLTSVLISSYAPMFLGVKFFPHFEMMAMFFGGVYYAYCMQHLRDNNQSQSLTLIIGFVSMCLFVFLSSRGIERTMMLICAGLLVHMALRITAGSALSDYLGDLSYGVYIFAFPVQQMLVVWGRDKGWGFFTYFSISFVVTCVLAYASWHLVEKRALRFKPLSRGSQCPA